VKVCCISSVQEARQAIALGAAAVGLVSQMPSGPGVIPDEQIAEIAQRVPPSVGSFLLTSHQDVRDIISQQRRCRANTIQICDRLETGSHDDLRAAMPGIALVQVVHVTGEESIDEACRVDEQGVDAILLDSGNQSLAVKELGGTGRSHDWNISRQIRESVDVPVFLAGGLRVENVSEAVQLVQPFGVDVCTGVRTNGQLDPDKLRLFFHGLATGHLPGGKG
jgi:phosphoribosylanthranilate isomerase